MVDRDFITGGRAIFTVEIPAWWAAANGAQRHYTFRVNRKEAEAGSPYGDTYFVSMLAGPDNTSDYAYVGILDVERGAVRLTKASRYAETTAPVRLLRRVVARLWAGDVDAIGAAGFALHHEGRCCRCGRMLTTPESIEAGIGPECAGRRGSELVAAAGQA